MGEDRAERREVAQQLPDLRVQSACASRRRSRAKMVRACPSEHKGGVKRARFVSRPSAEGVRVPAEGGRGEALVRQLQVAAAYELEDLLFFAQQLTVPLCKHRPAIRASSEEEAQKWKFHGTLKECDCVQSCCRFFLLVILNFAFKLLDFSIIFLFINGCKIGPITVTQRDKACGTKLRLFTGCEEPNNIGSFILLQISWYYKKNGKN